MIKLKNLITERVTSWDIIKIEKAIKKWHPQVRPLDGKIVSISEREVIVDINFKSDGVISRTEFKYNKDTRNNISFYIIYYINKILLICFFFLKY